VAVGAGHASLRVDAVVGGKFIFGMAMNPTLNPVMLCAHSLLARRLRMTLMMFSIWILLQVLPCQGKNMDVDFISAFFKMMLVTWHWPQTNAPVLLAS